MTEKEFFKINIFRLILMLFLTAVIVIIIDPYFHYHKPFSFLAYKLEVSNQRYVNNGIVKHFDYNAVIIGTSMTENFKSTQFNKLFNTNSIKIPFSGGSYKEINDNVERALKKNKKIKYILRGLDYGKINEEFNEMPYDSYPEYLYDYNVFNDYKYWWNKEILIKGVARNLIYTVLKKETTSFDEYSNWDNLFDPGKEKVLKSYKRRKKEKKEKILTQEDINRIDKNIEENVIKLPKQYPNVKFIYFITPYSIIYWDELNQKGEIEKQIMAEKYMIEKILKISNIELYSFFDNYEMITNLDNYKDAGHYMGHINDQILVWIKNKEYRITKENYNEYINKNLEFYEKYDYNKIFEESTERL